jgi:predicted DCC family thiol-disulfide oxidoreductase YuxK
MTHDPAAPSPGQIAPVLIYDGDCSFCLRWVERFKRFERGDRVRLLPLQDADAASLSGRSESQLRDAMHLVLPDGRVFAGATAARELTRFLPPLFGVGLRALFALPGGRAVANRVYALVAGNRYRMGCEGGHCSVPVAPDGRDPSSDGAGPGEGIGS